MQRSRLFLHIGQPKTGTTSLQSFLALNRGKLIEEGWLYPKAGRQASGHHQFAKFFRNDPPDWIQDADPELVRKQLRGEIKRTGAQNVVISSEAFFIIREPAKVHDYFKLFDVTIVVYLRRQDEWLESLYREQLKNGATDLPPAEYLKRVSKSLNYWQVLERWRKVFGEAKIIVVPFERCGKAISSEAMFLKAVELESGTGLTPVTAKNERLNRDCLQFLARMKTSRRIGRRFALIKDALAEYSKANPDEPAHLYFFPPKVRAQLVARYRESNDRVAKLYLGESQGALFHQAPPDPSEPWNQHPELRAQRAVLISEYLLERFIALE